MFVCSLTGQPITDPVVTPRGVLYERKSIEAYLETTQTCPVDGLPLTTADLIPVRSNPTNAAPAEIRHPTVTGMLEAIQREWNSLEKELFDTRRKLAEAKTELAQALYEKEAARNVIRRLLDEKREQSSFV